MPAVPTEAKNIADVAVRVREVLELGTAAAAATTDFATAAQGVKADSALQPATIGTTVQAYDADLSAIAALTSASDKVPYATGAGTWALADFSAAGRALVDDADAAAQRATLGLGTMATQGDTAVDINGGSITGVSEIRSSLGILAPVAGADVGSFSETVIDGNIDVLQTRAVCYASATGWLNVSRYIERKVDATSIGRLYFGMPWLGHSYGMGFEVNGVLAGYYMDDQSFTFQKRPTYLGSPLATLAEAAAGGGGAGVSSFAGRTGAVTPTTGDYDSTQIPHGAGTVSSALTDISGVVSGLGTAAVLNTGRAIGNVLKYEDFGGFPALITDSRFIFNKPTPTLTDVWNVGVLRNVSSLTGGTPGFVNAALHVNTTVGSVSSFEWGFLSTLTVNGAGGGEHCAGYFQGVKNGDNALWSLCTELREYTTDPTTGSLGIEIGMFVTGTDAHGSRHGIDMSIGSANNLTGTNVVTTGIRIGPSAGDATRAQLVTGIEIKGRAITGIDLSNLDIVYSDTTMKLPTNGKLRWKDGDGFGGATRAELAWNNVIDTFQFSGMKTQAGAGAVVTRGVIQVNGTEYAIDLRALS